MAVVRKNNIVSFSANNDSISGPLYISNIKSACGASPGLVTLTIGGVQVYQQQVAANSTPPSDYCSIVVGGADTLSVGLTGNTSVVVYLGDIIP